MAMREGTLVGTDQFGNKYFENKAYQYGAVQRCNENVEVVGWL